MKRELFYCLICCFLSVGICHGETPDFDKETQAQMQKRMQELKEYNKQQEENRLKLEDYQKDHTDLVEAKKEDYWDLAWHARLADYGDPESQFMVAQAYETGKQVEPSPQKAVAFYKKAAEQGHIESCMKLGKIYTENKWLQRDDDKALYWYTKAATKGYTQAQFKIAEIYADEEKYDKAYQWMEAALKQMFPNQKNLEDYSPELKQLGEKIREKAPLKVRSNKKEGAL